MTERGGGERLERRRDLESLESLDGLKYCSLSRLSLTGGTFGPSRLLGDEMSAASRHSRHWLRLLIQLVKIILVNGVGVTQMSPCVACVVCRVRGVRDDCRRLVESLFKVDE